MKTLAMILLAGAAAAQVPDFKDAQLERRNAAGNTSAAVRSLVGEDGPMWFGYTVESRHPGDDWNCGANLESETGGRERRSQVKLEGPGNIAILFRVQDHAVRRLRFVDTDCRVDAGGLRVVFLDGVTADESLRFLSPMVVKSEESRGLADSALAAIAMHRAEAATAELNRFSRQEQPEWLREKALFWLATSRGEPGLEAVERAAASDPSDNIRDKAMFDYSVSQEPRAVDDLIRAAKDDRSSRVRGQALFWLAQKAGQKIAKQIAARIDDDPDTDVKKKAVFALTNVPNGDGVPLLIEVAKNNQNLEVRKQAMFWLGQSRDPRAVAFFEQVLEH